MKSLLKSLIVVLTAMAYSCGNQNNSQNINTPTPVDSTEQRTDANDSARLNNSMQNDSSNSGMDSVH